MKNSKLQQNVLAEARARLATDAVDGNTQLNNTLRLLAKWRSVLLQNTVLQQHGTVVMQGPLAGLDFLPQSAEGCHVPKLLGCYEQPLQPHIQAALSAAYPVVLNIGCAEGYYAVGMARRMAATRVLAFDLNPVAQQTCTELAAKNGVADRVTVGALFGAEDFATYAGQRALVLCDIEGAEEQLLDPAVAPALAGMDLIVESHECLKPGVTATLTQRFEATHHITVVHDDGQRSLTEPPEWFRNLAHLDQLLAVWEWRSGPTPWLVMTARGTPPTRQPLRKRGKRSR
ncbi:MAG: class I SAM-dependent methyltransferase [Rhodocyclaceae bacterium]|nr:class I SAM-dependent methyltransferase [Rhodocyclaceae bacterium]